jgi:hypothetical protein
MEKRLEVTTVMQHCTGELGLEFNCDDSQATIVDDPSAIFVQL